MTEAPDQPRIPNGQPTWARVRHGAGCSLPRRNVDGGMTTLPTAVPIRLQYVAYDTARNVHIWQVPARSWSPGDAVEIGPLPHDVIVTYAVDRPNHAFMAAIR